MEPDTSPRDLFFPVDRSTPRHSWSDETSQYRVKLQRYTNTPPEFVIQNIDFGRDLERYRTAAERGHSSCFRPRGRRLEPSEDRSDESLERSQRRSKTQLRKLVTELAPNHFCTFTIRETGPDYFTPEDWRAIWAHFVRLTHAANTGLQYVAVLERHPSNPDHLHLHVAIRAKSLHYNFMRRLWHIAICAHRGVKVSKMLRGVDAPGNIQDKPVKAPRGSFKHVRKIARYISKYITKDLISEFNKKRYWPSKGISLESAQVFYLDALSMPEAIREACVMLGQWDHRIGAPGQKLFNPSDRVAWCAINPDDIPPPPF
jgi:hypothetical protein